MGRFNVHLKTDRRLTDSLTKHAENVALVLVGSTSFKKILRLRRFK